jgi:hypothetical protein
VDHAGERGQDILGATSFSREVTTPTLEKSMVCNQKFTSAIAFLLITMVASPTPAPAQSPSTTTDSKKLTTQKLKEMRAKWKANKPKLKACRAEVRKKGLIGDDRWFFIEECMDKA